MTEEQHPQSTDKDVPATQEHTDSPVELEQDANAIPELPEDDSDEEGMIGVNYEQTGPVIEEGEAKGSQAYQPYLSFYNYGMQVVSSYTNHTDFDNDVISNYTPDLIHSGSMSAEGSLWSQHIRREDGSVIGPRRPRLASTGGTLTGMAAIESIRRAAGSGGSLTYELAHSGLVITMSPVKESEMVDLQFDLTKAATHVGLSTTGLLLNGRSGVFSEALVNLALDHITSCNYKAVGNNFRELANVIDALDYGALVWGMLATTLANGHPWEFVCGNGECKHRREALINFSRTLWVNRNGLTERQQVMLTKHSNNITEQQLTDYRNDFSDKVSSYTMSTGIIIHWKRTTLAEYLKHALAWVSTIERQYNTAMTNYYTDMDRRRYLNTQIQSRRMHKYLHQIDKMLIPSSVEGEYEEISGPDDIANCLLELTAITPDIREFETAAIAFIEENTIQVVGYPAVACKVCNHTPKGRGGEYRSIVPFAVDRVFFTLVQQKTSALSELASV